MKHFTIILCAALALAAPAMAMHHDNGGHGDHGQVQKSGHEGHGGMAASGNLLELGDVTVKGVKAHAEMKDVRASMAKMGMKTTHHFMIMFNDEKTGKVVETGRVAVKITAPDGTVSEPIELMGMSGHFGADVTLEQPGEYRFQVGSKLADGEARQFEFKTVLK